MSSILNGKHIQVSVFGQSHSAAIGAVIDGLPAGFRVDEAEISAFMARRAPGKAKFATSRKEADAPVVLSGLADGVTCGAPLGILIQNTNTRSGDYSNLRTTPRPSHSDYAAAVRYGGFNDIAGGGHFSGRLTAPLCYAGAHIFTRSAMCPTHRLTLCTFKMRTLRQRHSPCFPMNRAKKCRRSLRRRVWMQIPSAAWWNAPSRA